MYIQTEKTIAIAHLVQTADKVSPCRHLHGHNLRVVVSIDGDVKDDGMVVDFRYVKEIINHYDHRTLIPCHLIQDVNANKETTVYIDTGYSRIVLPADDVVPMCIPVVTSDGDVKDDGMVVDFRYGKEITNHYDHRTLIPCHLIQDVNANKETTVYIDTGYSRIVLPADDVVPMCIPVVTFELLAMQILEEIEDILDDEEDYVTVTIYESEKSFVEVSSDE